MVLTWQKSSTTERGGEAAEERMDGQVLRYAWKTNKQEGLDTQC